MKTILTMLLGCLLLLPTVALASPITYDFYADIGGTSGTVSGSFTINPKAKSIGTSTLRDGGLLYPVQKSEFTITPNYTSSTTGFVFPNATGSAVNYCSGYCVFGTHDNLTVLNYEAGDYKGRLIFGPNFGAFQANGSDLGWYNGTTWYANTSFTLRNATLTEVLNPGQQRHASVPEPDMVWLLLLGLCAVVGVAQWRKVLNCPARS